MAWRLRRAERSDAAALSLVAGATFLEAYSHFIQRDDLLAHLSAKSSPTAFAEWIDDEASIVTLAEGEGGAPIGYTVLTPSALPVPLRPDDIELLRIYVLAPYWGGGPGDALLARAVADARAAGKGRMLLGTHPENVRAHRFYEKNGFSVIGRRRFTVGGTTFDDPVYARDL